jgi:dUTP pyrophosphatase
MKVKIKRLVEEAVLPRYMRQDDSGMDLVAVSKHFDEKGNVVYGTGLAFEIPVGYVGLLFPRSSNADKDLVLSNSVGVIDPGYRGEVKLKFKPSGYFACVPTDDSEGNISDTFDFVCFGKEDEEDTDNVAVYSIGDRIGQIIIIERPLIEWEEVVELSMNTERGTGGYGSTNTGMTSFEGPTTL